MSKIENSNDKKNFKLGYKVNKFLYRKDLKGNIYYDASFIVSELQKNARVIKQLHEGNKLIGFILRNVDFKYINALYDFKELCMVNTFDLSKDLNFKNKKVIEKNSSQEIKVEESKEYKRNINRNYKSILNSKNYDIEKNEIFMFGETIDDKFKKLEDGIIFYDDSLVKDRIIKLMSLYKTVELSNNKDAKKLYLSKLVCLSSLNTMDIINQLDGEEITENNLKVM